MKTNKRKEQFKIANILFEMGLDFDVIEKVSGISPQELLMEKINMVEYENDIKFKKETDEIIKEDK